MAVKRIIERPERQYVENDPVDRFNEQVADRINELTGYLLPGAKYFVSPSESDHGAASRGTNQTVYDVAQTVGTSNYATIVFRHTGDSSTTTYTFDTSFDASTYPNLYFMFEPGAVISRTTGDEVLTIYGPGNVIANYHQTLTTIGMIVFENHGIASVRWFGAVGDGATDDATALNNAADACRAKSIPTYFPAGNYYTEDSIDFTDSNDLAGTGSGGWKIYGAGKYATQITGNLSTAHPILDFTASHAATVSGMRITGSASGSQICSVLFSEYAAQRSRKMIAESVLIDGTYSEAGIIVCGADFSRVQNSEVWGPISVLFTKDTNALGAGVISSKYQTVSASSVTEQFIESSTIYGMGGDSQGWDSAIVADDIQNLTVLNSYVSQTNDAKAGIMISGDTYQNTSKYIGSRYENQTAGAGTFFWVENTNGVRSCELIGEALASGGSETGQIFYLEGGDIISSRIELNWSVSTWPHFVQRTGSTNLIKNCIIVEPLIGALMDGSDASLFGGGNIIYLDRWHDNWSGVADTDTFFCRQGASSGSQGAGSVNSIGWNILAASSEMARQFSGVVTVDYLLQGTTGPAGSDETLDSYTLSGDIASATIASKRATLKFTAWGTTASNANAKTIKAKFGVSGSETTVVYNDQTGSPNNLDWIIEADLVRMNATTSWRYIAKMFIGTVQQSISEGSVSADPDSSTVVFLLTGDGAASDITLTALKVEVY